MEQIATQDTHLLVGASLEHVAMRREDVDCFAARLGRLEVEVGALGGTKVPETLMREDNVLDLVIEYK